MNQQLALTRPRWAAVLLVILGGVIFTWPLLVNPLDLYGHVQGEASNHLWMFWRAGVDGPVANLPHGLPLPLMDPVNWPIYAAFAWVHPALGYNAVFVFNLVLAFSGAVALARAFGVSWAASFTAGVACAFSPFLSGLGSFGITESWGIGWLGFHCAFLLRYSESGRFRSAVGAALCLIAYLLTGWYSAVFAVVAEAVLLLTLWRRGRLRLGVWVQGAVAAAVIFPRLMGFWADRAFWADRWVGAPAPLDGQWEAWRELPRSGADLLNLVLPSVGSVAVSKSVYLGLLVLLMAVLAGRAARVVVLWSLPFLVLALGTHLMVAGHQSFWGVHVALPAEWIRELITPMEGLTHWYRALGPAVLFLSVAAALGVERLAVRWPKALLLVPLAVFFEGLLLSQTPWPRALISVSPPAIYQGLDEQGVLLQLPLHNERREFSVDEPRVYNRWQPIHGLPVVENYEGPDDLLVRNPWLRALQELCIDGRELDLSLAHQRMWAKELHKQGVRQIVVHGVASREVPDAWQCGRPQESVAVRQRHADATVLALESAGARVVLREGGDALLLLSEP